MWIFQRICLVSVTYWYFLIVTKQRKSLFLYSWTIFIRRKNLHMSPQAAWMTNYKNTNRLQTFYWFCNISHAAHFRSHFSEFHITIEDDFYVGYLQVHRCKYASKLMKLFSNPWRDVNTESVCVWGGGRGGIMKRIPTIYSWVPTHLHLSQ